jgi:outer membrane biosynthesis protein TonB
MRLVIHRASDKNAADSAFGFLSDSRVYPRRPRSFGYSLLFHVAVVTFLLLQKNTADAPDRPIYDTIIRPRETKIIWQPLQRKLPDIDSSTHRAKVAPSRGKIQAPQVVIADSKTGSKSEFVFQDKPVELPKEVKAPNLIALKPPAVPEAQPSPPPKPREFVPPPPAARPQPAQPAQLALAPPPVADANPKLTASLPQVLETDPVKVYRAFVAPPPSKKSGAGSGTSAAAGPDAPKVDLASNANIAAVNLDSILGAPSALPAGRRPGNFSSAPVVGDPAAEKSGKAALVPGLTVRGGGDSAGSAKPATPAPSIPKKEVAYHEVMSRPIGSSLSVPLRPGARRIPAALDLKFRDRPVYTMILPAPKLPQYAGDWVLWFSEVKPTDGFIQIRAPLPEKQLVPDAPSPYTWGAEAYIRINLVIDESGHVQSAAVGSIPADMQPQIALEDVRAWQFKPATRNGVAIPVDAVLDIPFRRAVANEGKH